MTRVARYVFAALVVATFGAFFVAQRLKNGPTLVQNFYRDPVFSPTKDGRLDRLRLSFLVEKEDDVTVDVVNTKGDRVKRLADNRRMTPYKALFLRWDGTADDGGKAPDGIYRARVALRREGRSVVIQKSFRKDTLPPVVRVTGIGPTKADGPELFPTRDGKPLKISFSAPPSKANKITIFRTYPGPVEPVFEQRLDPSAKSFEWDGERDNGRRVRPGTYLAVVEARDRAQIVGTSVPLKRDRTPQLQFGRRLPGQGGITVRYLGVQPPMAPLPAGRSTQIGIDARGEKVNWSLRRAGGGTVARRSGGLVASGPVRVPIPRGESGLFVLTVRAGSRKQQVALPVRSSNPHRVLVVLPAITWAGRNPADDDGDGAINTLDRGVGATVNRIMVGDGTGLPVGLGQQEAKILAYLDANKHRYDLTTDWALNQNPPIPAALDTYRGVILAGDTRWLPPRLGARLRRFVRNGGRLASFGTRSLRAQVSVSRKGRLFQPTALEEEDLFGARIGPLVRGDTTLTSFVDRLEWFAGGTGELTGYTRYEPTIARDRNLRQVAAAVTTDATPRTVVVGARFGRGLVLRTGLPEFPLRIDDDPNSTQLMERTWTLLSR